MDLSKMWGDSVNTVSGWFSTEQSADLLSLGSVAVLVVICMLVGAFLAIHNTRKLTKIAISNQLQSHLIAEQEAVDGFLQALHVESKVAFEAFQSKIGKELETLEPGEAFLKHFVLSNHHFCVYHNNTQMLGAISNDALRLQIVKANTLFKAFQDTLGYHDQLVDHYNQLDLLAHQSQKPIDEGAAKRQLHLVKEHTKALKLEHSVMSAQMYQMIAMLRSHRNTKASS